jgi:hypothetical protein
LFLEFGSLCFCLICRLLSAFQFALHSFKMRLPILKLGLGCVEVAAQLFNLRSSFIQFGLELIALRVGLLKL